MKTKLVNLIIWATILLLYSCNTAQIKEERLRIDRNQSIIKDQIIIQFTGEADKIEVLNRFDKYSARIIKDVDPVNHTHVLRYDTLKIEPARMKVKLENQDGVKMLEFDKRLKLRKRGGGAR